MPAIAAVEGAVGAILGALEEHQDEIATTIVAALLSEVDGYRPLKANDLVDEFREQCKQHLRLLVKMARTGRPPQPEEVEFIRQVGIRRADEVSPLHVLLQGYRVGQRLVWGWIVRQAGTSPEGMRAALSLTDVTFDYLDIACGVVSAAYLQRSQQLETDAHLAKRNVLDDLLAGRAVTWTGIASGGATIRSLCRQVASA